MDIRRTKLEAAEGGFDAVMAKLKAPAVTSDKKAAVVGGGPAGLAAAYFLARGGVKVTLFEKEDKMGGVVRNVIPAVKTTVVDMTALNLVELTRKKVRRPLHEQVGI